MRKLLGVVLPSALLAVLVTAACDVGTPVDPDLLPNLGVTSGILGCPDGFTLAKGGKPADRNDDGYICFKTLPTAPDGSYRQVEIDNTCRGASVGCPEGFIITSSSGHPNGGDEADRNRDGLICVKDAPHALVLIDNMI